MLCLQLLGCVTSLVKALSITCVWDIVECAYMESYQVQSTLLLYAAFADHACYELTRC